MAASVESEEGEIAARLNAWVQEWKELRPKLIKTVDRHPSDEVMRLGHELAEDVEKLLQGLVYMASSFTDVRVQADVSKSVIDRHDHAGELADQLLQKVRAY
jgi:K+/H+ antiporter YhaU regulatory subunit KhtT